MCHGTLIRSTILALASEMNMDRIPSRIGAGLCRFFVGAGLSEL